ncbi:MAG: ATP-binding protein [Kiritimatiellae bacterium]|jgi:AAA15 family ATPase/GTPase|nr:ATP-binding protein [Kiritimatiellia bacterium]
MLVSFTVENFCSIKEKNTLSMERIKRLKDLEENIVEDAGKSGLLKSAVIYGANASGKSNIVRALAYMRKFIGNSHENRSGDDIDIYEPFLLNEQSREQPTLFEIKFVVNEKIYRYGFKLDKENIHSEWLFEGNKSLFLRTKQEFDLKGDGKTAKDIIEKTKENMLFLSTCDQWNVSFATELMKKFFNKLLVVPGHADGLFTTDTHRFVEESLENKQKVIDLLKFADTGITDLEIEDLKIQMQHEEFGSLSLNQESEGTKKLFNLAGLYFVSIANDNILVVDEFDARLHTSLAKALINMFQQNSNKAQLIIASHDTNIMTKELFRRDQVWFTEKDIKQQTHLYSLAEFKIRNDEVYEKNYLAGKYGAIPFFGEFDFLETE